MYIESLLKFRPIKAFRQRQTEFDPTIITLQNIMSEDVDTFILLNMVGTFVE